jgi:hypothetical protein
VERDEEKDRRREQRFELFFQFRGELAHGEVDPIVKMSLAKLRSSRLLRSCGGVECCHTPVMTLGGERSSNRTATAALDPADATGERWHASWQTRLDPTGLHRLQGPPGGGDDGP